MKHLKHTILALVLAISLLAGGLTAGAAVTFELGDVDGDGAINANDALLALQHSVSIRTLDDEQKARADVNADGAINANDALLMLQYSVGIITTFQSGTTVAMPWSESTQVFAQESAAIQTNPIRTTFQQAGGYAGEMDVQSDSVMAYISGLSSVDSTFDSWKNNNQSGRQIDVMIPGGRDDGEYFRLYPEREKKDAHRWSDGSWCYHGGGTTVHYMMPTTYYTEYKWTLVDKICQKGPGFITIEEPEFFTGACYNDGFYEEWKNYYGTDFVDPNTSAEARYMASKLMSYMWVRMYETIGERMQEKYPEVGLVVAAHSTRGYNGFIISSMNGYTSVPYLDAVIGQTWSDTANGARVYRGNGEIRVFEAAYFEYATYPDSMQDGQVVYTLTDAKADNDSLTWDRYEYLWQETLVAELLQPEINHFQECVWPSRGFTPAPDRYRTVQLTAYNLLHEVGDYGSTLYAGTPGIYLGLSDTLTFQTGFMLSSTTNEAIDGLTIPLVEKGIPLGVKALEYIDDVSDLDGVKMLILSYDMQKPQSEAVNTAIAQWVKEGGVLLYLGGYNDYDTVSSEWWTKQGQTPYENLLGHLGLNNIQVDKMDYLMSYYRWCGPSGFGGSFQEGDFLLGEMAFANHYTGSGFTPVLENDDYTFGIDAKVGKGRLISVGLPSAYYGKSTKGPEQLRDLVAYACRYTDVSYVETDLMAIQRGPFIAAHALDYGGEQTMKGDFVDLFDESLPILSEKKIQAGHSALLYDLTQDRKAGHPVLVHTGANLRSEVTETADTTEFSASGPTNSVSASRFLGNGKYPVEISVTRDGTLFKDYIASWDNASGSLLLSINHQADEEVTVKITWGDTPVADTPAYVWDVKKIDVNSNQGDAEYVFKDTAVALYSMKACRYDGELIYRFDLSQFNDPYFTFNVSYNYVVEVSPDGEHYTKVYDYRDISDEYVTSAVNRVALSIFPELYESGNEIYVRFSNTDLSQKYGAAVMSMYLYNKRLLE